MPPLSTARLRQVKAHLAAGGTIAYATESCYGFGCDPFNCRAVRRLLRLKHRPQQKGLIVVGADWRQLQRLMPPLSAALRARAQAKWPTASARRGSMQANSRSAHTWLMPPRASVPAWLRGKHARIALRIPSHAGARGLCAQVNLPLVSTSANRSSMVSIKSYRECCRQFGFSVLVLRGRIGGRRRPSSIEDLLTGQVIRG